ncbi:MAG: serine/threonine-protein kinase [Verrucomicrobiota bacterium]|jgi:serine/threonine-protein kinase
MKLGSQLMEPAASAVNGQKHASGEFAPGNLLDDRFAIKDVICIGGMAAIYKAIDLQNNGRLVAIKIPHRTAEADPSLFARFQTEEKIGCELDHPSILKFYPARNKSRMYLVMEFLEGKTLYQLLRERRVLPEAEALALAGRLCEPMQYLHDRGILHRDLKPENIMLCNDGTLRLMDFGIARLASARRMTFIGFAPGTPHYMAPERVNGKRGDPRTDIYSLGAVLYEMLTGVIPFNDGDITAILNARVTGDPESLRRLNPKISPHAEEIVLRAMERDPDKRYPTAAALKAALDEPVKVELTGRCDRLEPSTPFKRGLRKARTVALWALLPVAVQVLLFFLIWHHLKHGK